MSQSIRHFFLQIEDFRQPGKCSYRLADLLLTGLCTLLSNGQDYEDMRGRPCGNFRPNSRPPTA